MSPKITEIGFFRNNKKKTNKISQISYFFRLSFWCIGKLDVHQKYPLTQLLFIYICVCGYIYMYISIYIYIYTRGRQQLGVGIFWGSTWSLAELIPRIGDLFYTQWVELLNAFPFPLHKPVITYPIFNHLLYISMGLQ